MKERNVALCIVLSLVTCGIYGLYWFVCLTDDSLYISKEDGASGVMALVFSIITCGIYSLYWSYKMGDRIDIGKSNYNIPGGSNNGILYLVLSFFGLGIISWALMQSELNRFADKMNYFGGETQ